GPAAPKIVKFPAAGDIGAGHGQAVVPEMVMGPVRGHGVPAQGFQGMKIRLDSLGHGRGRIVDIMEEIHGAEGDPYSFPQTVMDPHLFPGWHGQASSVLSKPWATCGPCHGLSSSQ